MSKVESLNQAVRGLVTLGLIATLCYGFLLDKISSEAFVGIVSGVVTFWFASRQQQTRTGDQPTGGANGKTTTPDPATTS